MCDFLDDFADTDEADIDRTIRHYVKCDEGGNVTLQQMWLFLIGENEYVDGYTRPQPFRISAMFHPKYDDPASIIKTYYIDFDSFYKHTSLKTPEEVLEFLIQQALEETHLRDEALKSQYNIPLTHLIIQDETKREKEGCVYYLDIDTQQVYIWDSVSQSWSKPSNQSANLLLQMFM